jgi:hypothetical protein
MNNRPVIQEQYNVSIAGAELVEKLLILRNS